MEFMIRETDDTNLGILNAKACEQHEVVRYYKSSSPLTLQRFSQIINVQELIKEILQKWTCFNKFEFAKLYDSSNQTSLGFPSQCFHEFIICLFFICVLDLQKQNSLTSA